MAELIWNGNHGETVQKTSNGFVGHKDGQEVISVEVVDGAIAVNSAPLPHDYAEATLVLELQRRVLTFGLMLEPIVHSRAKDIEGLVVC
ncbi:MAG: hypothetical protein LAT62_15025 [Natronospirillum sp.]|uniref:hypothetical protein n=1 Tax=Natronospirillum sp. TaxID=2812955 RepID=UPI0025D3AA67|nr:hypothetical protein [Natronospirillum sp.]MCH8553249.1 hypothetical protein [Natronospirillum sp.]